jgi:hypothetical protein
MVMFLELYLGYGQYDLDTVADWYNSDGSDISWEWFKTEQERDQAFKENENE